MDDDKLDPYTSSCMHAHNHDSLRMMFVLCMNRF